MKNNVRKYRTWKCLTQAQLADMINISISRLQRIDANDITPNADEIKNLCKVFGISKKQLFEE